MCFEEGILQAYIDDELNIVDSREVQRHLEHCKDCMLKVKVLQANGVFVGQSLDDYLSNIPETSNNNNLSIIENLKHDDNLIQKVRRRSINSMRQYKKIVACAAMVATLVTAFSFPGVRSMASEFLNVFRMEKVQTINISTSDLKELEKALDEGASKTDTLIGNIEVVGKNESVPVPVTLEEASASVDFDIVLPRLAGYAEPELMKTTGNTINFTLDVANANGFLRSLGSDQLLPENIDGKKFQMVIPNIISSSYSSANDQVFIMQARSPELKAPSGVDALAIRDALFNIPALPQNLRNQLLAVDDWQHTALIPNVDGQSREVTVNGSQGVFNEGSPVNDPMNSKEDAFYINGVDIGGSVKDTIKYLVWQQNGVIYTIIGENLDEESALAIAEQIK